MEWETLSQSGTLLRLIHSTGQDTYALDAYTPPSMFITCIGT